MAIAAGRRLSDRLFGGMKDAKADYTNVPVCCLSTCLGLLVFSAENDPGTLMSYASALDVFCNLYS